MTNAAETPAEFAKAKYAARETELWRDWHDDRSARNRHALVDHYAGWTRLVARDVFQRIRIQGTEWADYVHYATIGLLECIERFDASKGVHFQTYARHRLRGAILNNIGRFAERTGHDRDAAARYSERTLSLAEDDSGDALRDVLEVSVGLAIGYLLELGTLPGDEHLDSDAYRQVEAEHTERQLCELVEQLPDNERLIVRCHYYQQMNFVDIANLLELTKGRISQLHRQAMNRIRERMERQDRFQRNF